MLPTRRDFVVRGLGLGLLLGSAGACRVAPPTMKEGHEFFDPNDLPWHPAPGHSPGVWERIVSGGRDEGVTTRFLRFDPGSGRDAVVTHDFWEEINIVLESSSLAAKRTRQAAWRCALLEFRTARSTRPLGVSISRFATEYRDEGCGWKRNRA